MNTVAIILLNWNGLKDTLECLASLEKITYPNFFTIVADNGSSEDPTVPISTQFPHVTLLKNPKNLGFSEGNNVAIRYALAQGADRILLLNNDTIVDKGILEAFTQAEGKADILGAKLYSYKERGRFDHFGGKWNGKTAQFDLVGQDLIDDGKSFERMAEIDYACGAALYVKKEVFNAIGLLEPLFFLYYEDSDFCFRARRAGFLTMTCPNAKVWHKGSVSVVGGKPHATYFSSRNRLLWIERNCSSKERLRIGLTILIPEIFKLYRHFAIKQSQLTFLRLFRPKIDVTKKRQELQRKGAALRGVHDYLLRRFGEGG